MKRCFSSLALLLLLAFSLTSIADRVLITNRPIILKPDGGFFRLPQNYTFDLKTYHFVSIAHENRVCYLKPQYKLAALDVTEINLSVFNRLLHWYCYRFDPRFFEIDY